MLSSAHIKVVQHLLCATVVLALLAVLLLPEVIHAAQVGELAPRDLDALAAEVVALHAANGGATVNLYHGDRAGQPLYAVVVFPELSVSSPGRALDAAWVRAFIDAHLPLLRDARYNVGSWYDIELDESYLDLSTALPDREQALALGRQYNQHTVFDLLRLESIDAGGTGALPSSLPPWDQRLPAPAR